MPAHQTYVAGHKFRPADCQECLLGLAQDDDLELVPDPDNQHDPNAVKVMKDGKHLGFVPRDLAANVRQLLAEGRVVRVHKRTANTGIAIEFIEKE